MKRHMLFLLMTAALLVAVGCSGTPDADPQAIEPADSSITAATSSDPLSGTWTGDWGPSERDRNDVSLELKWDGVALTGTVNPGPNAIPLSKASYDPATGTVMMEADATGHDGKAVHYVIEGKVEGNTMTGTWGHDARKGDFKITKS